LPSESLKEIVGYVLKQLPLLEIKVSCLYLDRGFSAVALRRYLKESRQRAIIASPLRGQTGGLKALCVGRKSYRTKHVFQSREHGPEEVAVALYKGLLKKKKTKKKEAQESQVIWLADILLHCEENLSAKTVQRRYRRRFGIESSYRCATSLDTPEKVREAFGAIPAADVMSDLNAGLTYLNSRPNVKKNRLASIGFCWGGARSFLLSTEDNKLRAAVVFYGTAPTEE
jgi:hypothetical protein